ncbi:MAG TPA: type II toxin-antitoxin system HicB family antitoxin [Bryobacteraceae bacterium]|nr:type II toxin-antitoxin system HicB family antitoxin [Bryobacteraceae bacterium]
MLAYPALFEPEGKGFVITFPDIPEAISEGNSAEEAMEYAIDALQTVLSEYINRRREIPRSRRRHGKNVRLVCLPALAEAKIGLYRIMRAKGVRKADLARRLGWQKSQVDRLLDLKHSSRLDQIETALNALDKRLTIQVDDAA